MTTERFAFGDNWADYVARNFSDERVEISCRHLLDFLKLDDLERRVFLDIGWRQRPAFAGRVARRRPADHEL